MESLRIIYGTAWKTSRTSSLVCQAIRLGYRAIDTACQPKHYSEEKVGEALVRMLQEGILRSELFIQTKFTSLDGQDPNQIPYDKNAKLEVQVEQSIAKSLENLQTNYIDSIVMHSPMPTHAQTMIVWKVFEKYHAQGIVRNIGVSNCYSIDRLKKLWNDAHVKPFCVQNRFYRESNYDQEIRKFCKEENIMYQSFWTLSANPEALKSEAVKAAAKRLSKTAAQIWFRFCVQIGITPLTGTCSESHMKDDLEVFNFELTNEEVEEIRKNIL